MIDLKMDISRADLMEVAGALRLSQKAVYAAARRAVLKTARSAQSAVRKDLSREMRIQQKLIRARLRLYRTDDALTQKIWLGLNAVAAGRLGKARRMKDGAKVGRHFFKGAFPIAKYGGGVYRRQGKERFPLELVKLDIDRAGTAVMRQSARDVEERLHRFMQQELRYELIKLNKRRT